MKNDIKRFDFPSKSKKTILSLGAESAGNFSIFKNGKIYYSEDFGDLLNNKNFSNFKKSVLKFIKKEKIYPNIIITDLHPKMKTTRWGESLVKKNSAQSKSASGGKTEHIKVQHHHAHILSQIFNHKLKVTNYNLYGIALDGTGFGLDKNIWGGEIFKISKTPQIKNHKFQTVNYKLTRIGHLENQTLIGGDLAIYEPARLLISILSKIKIETKKINNTTILRNMVVLDEGNLQKNLAYHFVKKYYNQNQFELLWNQFKQNFNCQKTSSAGRILDAVSILLGFAKNERKQKHEATHLLEKNSTIPYLNLKPIIKKQIKTLNKNCESPVTNYELLTTPLFKYLIKNLHRDKHRLASTTQLYIAQGLYEIIKKHHFTTSTGRRPVDDGSIILSGGISNNEIILNYFESKKNKSNISLKISDKNIPRGDAGLSVGQIAYYLFREQV